MEERMMRRVADSAVIQTQLVLNSHLNGAGRLFGGQLMEWIDIVATVVARRHAHCNPTTASVDNLQFKEAVHLNNTLIIEGKLTYIAATFLGAHALPPEYQGRADEYMEPHESDSGPPFGEVEPLNFQDEESVVHTVLEDFYAVGTLADELTDGFHMEAHGYLDREEVNARLIAFARKLEQVLDKWETHAALLA